MGEIMNSPKGVKSCVPEKVIISCPTCGTRHYLPKTTGNQSCDILSQLVTNPSTYMYVTQKCQICEQIKCCMHSKTFLNGPPMDWSNTVTLVRCSIYRGLIHGNLPQRW